MRLLRLDLPHGRSTIDLHPFVTVARDLSPSDTNELLETVRRLARGSTAGISGLVQNQGLLVDLDGFGDDGALAVTGANVVVDCDAAAQAGVAALQAQIEQTRQRVEIDAVVVEEIRANLDASARARVAILEAKLGPEEGKRLAALDAEIEQIAAGLEAAAAHPRVVWEATDEILELRRRWSDHMGRRGDAEQHFAMLMDGVKQAEDRVVAARAALDAAHEAAKPVRLSRAEEARLEALSFPELDKSRRGKWRKALRPEEEEEKAELLARVGVESWTEYTLDRVAPSPAPGKMEAARAAAKALATAEELLDEARSRLATDELTSQLNDAEDAIRAAARQHLGYLLPADVGAALEELVVEKPNPEWLLAVKALSDLLPTIDAPSVESATSPVPVEPGPDDAASVVTAAERWLETRRRERADIDFDRLRADLQEAEQHLARHERALPRLGRAEAAVKASRRRLAGLEELVAARGAHDSGAVDAVLGAIAPIAAQIEQEVAGSVPIAVLGRFDALGDQAARELMDALEQHANSLQILVISEHPAIGSWAEEAGLDRASVARPKLVDRTTAA